MVNYLQFTHKDPFNRKSDGRVNPILLLETHPSPEI
jgi:hypothetical protein